MVFGFLHRGVGPESAERRLQSRHSILPRTDRAPTGDPRQPAHPRRAGCEDRPASMTATARLRVRAEAPSTAMPDASGSALTSACRNRSSRLPGCAASPVNCAHTRPFGKAMRHSHPCSIAAIRLPCRMPAALAHPQMTRVAGPLFLRSRCALRPRASMMHGAWMISPSASITPSASGRYVVGTNSTPVA